MARLLAKAFGKVEGVSLEQLVDATIEMFGKDESEWDEVAQRHGFPPGRFKAIADAWGERMKGNPALVHTYNLLYQRAMEDAGIEAPDLSLEEYASIIKETGSGTPLEEALRRFGINVQQFSMLSWRMGKRMIANPTLAMRYAQLIAPGGEHEHGHGPPSEDPPPFQILS